MNLKQFFFFFFFFCTKSHFKRQHWICIFEVLPFHTNCISFLFSTAFHITEVYIYTTRKNKWIYTKDQVQTFSCAWLLILSYLNDKKLLEHQSMFAPFVKVVCESFGSQYHSHCWKGLVKDFFWRTAGSLSITKRTNSHWSSR